MRKNNISNIIKVAATSAAFVLFAVGSLIGCSNKQQAPPDIDIAVPEISGLSEDFLMGVDISSVISQEKSGVIYRDYDGNEQDIFKTLNHAGINYIRTRIWNNPWDSEHHSYGGGAVDIDTATVIGKRAADNNMKLLADFHYSDFWADPGKQKPPKAWENMDIDSKAAALYQYTKASLDTLISAGADIGMVQIGNETNSFFCGETDWENIAKLFSAGAKAVRETDSDILIALHFTNPEKPEQLTWFAEMVEKYNVDYDVFAVSYYSYWHGTADNLSNTLKNISERFGKYVMVAEMSFTYTDKDGDGFNNTISAYSEIDKQYEFSVQGQADGISDVIKAVSAVGEKGLGVFYWEPAWIPVPADTLALRQQLWEQYGSGWASSYSAEYDPDDAGKYYGGSSWDNQALFDFEGKPLDSLYTFRFVYSGYSPAE